MDQQLSHTRYLDHLQGEWIKDTRILPMFQGGLPNPVRNQKVAVEEGRGSQGRQLPPNKCCIRNTLNAERLTLKA
jgi:hypothetical protein